MIEIDDILSEFVQELGNDFIRSSKSSYGVTFYNLKKPNMKFGIATGPMFGIEPGKIGLTVAGSGYPTLDCVCDIEDPQLFTYLKERISAWCFGAGILETDW